MLQIHEKCEAHLVFLSRVLRLSTKDRQRKCSFDIFMAINGRSNAGKNLTMKKSLLTEYVELSKNVDNSKM